MHHTSSSQQTYKTHLPSIGFRDALCEGDPLRAFSQIHPAEGESAHAPRQRPPGAGCIGRRGKHKRHRIWRPLFLAAAAVVREAGVLRVIVVRSRGVSGGGRGGVHNGLAGALAHAQAIGARRRRAWVKGVVSVGRGGAVAAEHAARRVGDQVRRGDRGGEGLGVGRRGYVVLA